MVIGNIFEMLVIKAVQDWLAAIWMVNHLQVDHWWLLGIPLILELRANLNTCPGA